MIVSALGLVSPLSQGPAASKKFKDILPLLLGKDKWNRFYTPGVSFPRTRPGIPAPSFPEQKTTQDLSWGSTQAVPRTPFPILPSPLTRALVNFKRKLKLRVA